MFRVSLANAAAKRTCRPLYEKHQATPVGTFLDEAELSDVYSGMVMRRSGPDLIRLMDGAVAAEKPWGLAALDKNPVINDLDGLGLNVFAVWLGAPDAFFTIEAPAFDTGGTYAVPTTGARQLLYAGTGATKGKITSASNNDPVCELVEVVSANRLIVRLLPPKF